MPVFPASSRSRQAITPETVPKRRLSRRHFIAGTGAAGAAVATTAIGASPAAARTDLPAAIPVPEPIEGGFLLDPTNPDSIIHFQLPGHPGTATQIFGFPAEGLDVDPSTMTNFDGFHAMAVVSGTAQGSDGNAYDVEFDVRVMEGKYKAADGVEREAAFAFF